MWNLFRIEQTNTKKRPEANYSNIIIKNFYFSRLGEHTRRGTSSQKESINW